MEEGVLQGCGRQRAAPCAAVPLETQGGLLQAIRDPAARERGRAEYEGQGHGHSRYTCHEFSFHVASFRNPGSWHFSAMHILSDPNILTSS